MLGTCPDLSDDDCRELVLERSFFPPGSFSNRVDADAFTHVWNSTHLAAMEEPAFAEIGEQGFEAYRFLWLRTFSRPVVLRIQNEGSAKTLVVKQLSGEGGCLLVMLWTDPTTGIAQHRNPVAADERRESAFG